MAELTVPRVDFSPLGELGNIYKEAQKERGLQDAFSQGIGSDPQSLAALAQRVAPHNPQLAINLAQLSHSYTRQNAQDARQQGLDTFNQNMERQRLDLAKRAADRADDPTPAGFQKTDAGLVPIPGGPTDPKYLGQKTAATAQPDIPSGFQRDAVSGGLTPIPGGPADPNYLRQKGDKQNAPSGYIWNDPNDPSKGMTAIPGGPGEKVDAEVAGRLGLAKSFLGQLPDIKQRVQAGGITGPIDAAQAYMGMGAPGEIRRQMDSGAEALLRMLTGAGMNKEEAANYVRRYQFSPTDNVTTVMSKLNQLERELNSVGETVGKGRGGWTPPSGSPKPEPAKQDAQGFRAPPKVGELRDGYRYKGGNPGDPASWVKQQETAFSNRFDAAFSGSR